MRVGRRILQHQALYLGELNDSHHAEWQHAVEAFDETGNVRQLKIFQEDHAPKTDGGQVVRIREAGANDEGDLSPALNLPGCDPKTLWKRYMIQSEIKHAFRKLKNDLGLPNISGETADAAKTTV